MVVGITLDITISWLLVCYIRGSWLGMMASDSLMKRLADSSLDEI